MKRSSETHASIMIFLFLVAFTGGTFCSPVAGETGSLPALPQLQIVGQSVFCYNTSIELSHIPVDNSYSSSQREWDYGLYTGDWILVADFQLFLNYVVSNLSDFLPTQCESCNMSNISTAIYGTDYHFMIEYYNLYSDLSTNKEVIVQALLHGIENQYLYFLTNEERAFISSFFPLALPNGFFPPAYTPVVSWKHTIYVTSETASISASAVMDPQASTVTIVVRARLLPDGPYSQIKLIDIKPRAPTFNVSSSPSCPNSQTGQIILSGINGILPGDNYKCNIKKYDYEAGDLYYFSGQSITIPNYVNGNYKVYLYYNNEEFGGCKGYNPIEVKAYDELNIKPPEFINASCPESADGKITIKILNYAEYYIFRLNNQTFTNSEACFQNLDNGTYILQAWDQCNSTPKTWELKITEPPVVSIGVVAQSDPTCLSSPNGYLKAQASGGNSIYDFQLFNSSGTMISSSAGIGATYEYSTLPGGSYTVKARSGGCSWKSTGSSLNPVQPLSVSESLSPVRCFGDNSGEIHLSASGGKSPYYYKLGSNPYVSSPDFLSLAAGAYTVKVHTYDMSCNDEITKNLTITSSPKIQIGFNTVDVSCFDNKDGSITANASGGSGIFSYSWQEFMSGSWFPTPGTSNRISELYAGKYRVKVTDTWSCIASAEAVVSEPPPLEINSATPKDVACYGDNGDIHFDASGGSGGFEFSCHELSGQVYKASSPTVSVPSGVYYLTVKDSHGCEAVYDYYSEIIVNAPESPLEFTTSSPEHNGYNLLCHGDNSGIINVSASGGNGSGYEGYYYSLSGAPEITSGNFSGLHAGLHNLKVTDARGCTVEKNINLTEPASLNLQVISTEPVKCFGELTGGITVAAGGGIEGSYSYKLDGSEMSAPIFQNLAAGTYEIEVSDNNGCKTSINSTVESLHPPIGIVMMPVDVKCFGENNGSIETIVSGGSGGFSNLWEINTGSGWQLFGSVSDNLADLIPATYRIKATDSENCFAYNSTEIREPSQLVVSSVTPKDVVCFGEKGSLNITATGGVPLYTYYCQEKSGTTYDSPLSELQLPAGIYNVSLKDGKGCQANYPKDITITAPASILDFSTTLSSYNGFNVSCNGANDGYVVAVASGGNGSEYSGYKYSLNGSPYRIENQFGNIKSGSYFVRVTDARGCMLEKTVQLNEPQPLSLNLLYSKAVKCFGEPEGEISVLASGGMENTYRYNLNGDGECTTGTFKNLYAGNHTVNVADINGCTKSLQATIINSNPPIISQLTPTQVRCNGGNDGAITSLVSGGAGGFSFSWEKNSGNSWVSIQSAGPQVENLSASFYRMKLIDADNCMVYDSIAVNEPPVLEIGKINTKDAVCYGENGSFDILAKGGNGGYAFYVSDDAGTSYREYNPGDPLKPASYRFRVTDMKGCELMEANDHSITQPNKALNFEYELSKYGQYNISCHGNKDGSINVLPYGGNDYGYSGYVFQLKGLKESEEGLIKNLEAGSHELTVKDGRGCRITKTISLTEPPSLIRLRVAEIKQPKCSYENNGSVSLLADGGNEPYQFSVNSSSFSSSSVFSDLPVAHYNFKVKDQNGCAENIDTVLNSLISEMEVNGLISDVRCHGESSGAIDINVEGGASPYTFRWKDNPDFSASRTTLSKGNYTVTIADAAGCLSEKSFVVNEPELPLQVSALSSPACDGLKDGIITATAEGGTPPYQFAADRMNNYNPKSKIEVYSGNHSVYVSDINGCSAVNSINVAVRNMKPEINFMLATNRYEKDTLVIIDVSVPVPDEVFWEFPEGTIVIDTGARSAMVKYTQTGIYPVIMSGKFGSCTYSIEKLLNIAPYDPLVSGSDKIHKGIKTLVISPNPNNGKFELNLELYIKQSVAVKVFDYYGRILFNESWPAEISLRREIDLPGNLMPGNYILWVIGENDSRPVIFVISE